MGSVNAIMPFIWPDGDTLDWLFNVGDAIGVGDLMFDGGSDKARPADKQTAQLIVAADQATFAASFCGISSQQILSTETNATKRLSVWTKGICEFKCPSQTFNKGDLVGVYSGGVVTPDAQQVDKVTSESLAIGRVVKYYGSATTVVRFAFTARKYRGENLATTPGGSSVATVAAAGGNIATAAAVLPGYTRVTNTDNTKGVILPAAVGGTVLAIKNTVTGKILLVYPPIGTAINLGANNAVYNMASQAVRVFRCVNNALWETDPETIV